jgi:hypothetical protein
MRSLISRAIKLDVLGLGLTAVDGGRDATGITEFFNFRRPLTERPNAFNGTDFMAKVFFWQPH